MPVLKPVANDELMFAKFSVGSSWCNKIECIFLKLQEMDK